MRMLWSVSLAIALACYGLFAYLTLDRRSDEVKIRSLIEDTVAAIGKRDLGGTMRCVSENYRDAEELNRDRLRMLVAQAFRAEPEYTASADVRTLSVEGDSAVVFLRAVVKSRLGESIYNRELVLSFRRESGRHALIVPTKVWRVVSAQNLGLANQL
jgi:hypothetical protein